MNGVLVIDKPAGITSHDVVWRVRRILKIKRVGHTGTLDPFATGVMIVLVGRATRLAQFLDKTEKEYLATIRFGFETDTGDLSGNPKSEVQSLKSFSVQEFENVLNIFRGEIEQTPPMYSAKKVQGKKLYELARKGEEIERKAVKITISELQIAENPENQSAIGNSEFAIVRVVCSAGTYIRVLAEDIGKKLEIGAHLAELRRTRAGNFALSQAVTLEELEKLAAENHVQSVLISPNQALSHLPFVCLSPEKAKRTLNGMAIKTEAANYDFSNQQFVRLCDEEQNLIAVATFDENEKTLQPRVVLQAKDEI